MRQAGRMPAALNNQTTGRYRLERPLDDSVVRTKRDMKSSKWVSIQLNGHLSAPNSPHLTSFRERSLTHFWGAGLQLQFSREEIICFPFFNKTDTRRRVTCKSETPKEGQEMDSCVQEDDFVKDMVMISQPPNLAASNKKCDHWIQSRYHRNSPSRNAESRFHRKSFSNHNHRSKCCSTIKPSFLKLQNASAM